MLQGTGAPKYTPTTSYRNFTLTPSSPWATLDYGPEIEVKYSEQFTGLLEPFSDGPSLFVSSLANSFRVGTFNIIRTGKFGSKLLQGAFAFSLTARWNSSLERSGDIRAYQPAYAGFGLDYVNATVPTPRGNLSVSWTAKDSVVTVEIRSPVRTTGRLALTKEWAFEDGFVPKDCDKVQDVVYEIIGGVYHITHRVEA
ncbi:unnamed protein product [Penicillium camemberti]|uniref:Str. FM013 n=1 Tax=Penicillium camemberti (strain FM 013) TaxID=1429867 RepID=A0A0G4P9D5_PENC3|nr:unnamed protein product [Penicillium camemberti]